MTRKTFERGEAVEIKGGWRGAPWRQATFVCVSGDGVYAADDNGGVTHYVPSRRIRKRVK